MSLDFQVILENKLIRLEPLESFHFDALYEAAKDPLIWTQHTSNRFKTEEFALFFKESMESKGALVVIDNSKQNIIGSSRFKQVASDESIVEIGWSFLAREYWGGTYNRSMKKLMIEHAFTSKSSVLFYIAKENIRSQRACEKIGGVKVDKEQYLELAKGKPNHFIYMIHKKNYKL